MKDISFFSEDTYLYLPSRKNPKVILAVGKSSLAKLSFKIYNPFSIKAKVFKKIVCYLAVNFNRIFKKTVKLQVHENSKFIKFLNKQFDKKFASSIYNATLKDKVIIQLQSNEKIFGYVKFPLNEIGKSNVKNEIKAIEILTKKEVIDVEIQSFEFHKTPFFVMPELEGNIETVSDEAVLKILEPFKKEISFKLKNHKRILEIRDFLIKNELNYELVILEKTLQKSKVKYFEAFEHGDFAPWNIVKTKNGFEAFDFEYFQENGLEYLDIIKYHFQVGRLLKNKSKQELFNYLSQKIEIIEIKELLIVFLLKEIMVAIKQQKQYNFESEMLKFIHE